MKSIAIVLALAPAMLFADTRTQDLDRITDAANVLNEVMEGPNGGIPHHILARAQCVGVIPSLKGGALIIGAKYGKGVMVCRTAEGWSAPSTIIVEGGSVGLQLGGGHADVVLVVQNKSAEHDLMSGKFTLSANAGAIAGPVEHSATAETDAQLNASILTYSRTHGLFAGVDLGGATLRPDHDANQRLYGKDVTLHDILSGQVMPPAQADQLYAELNRYSSQPRG